MIKWAEIKGFKKSEFDDDRGGNWIKKRLVKMLERSREKSGVQYVVTSACRNEEQNKRVGGSRTSSHLKGYAVDISATDSIERFKILKGLIEAGFKRIGIGEDFIHVDCDPEKTNNLMWLYK